jgi:hypothetical protein
MLTKAPHLFDDATRVTAGDRSWQGRTSDDYWAFVGPFGGATAATILRALIDHPQRSGDPLSVTVNFCAPIAQGGFDLDLRLVRANKSTQHWSVELTQGDTEVATLATAVFAERRPSWSHQQAEFRKFRRSSRCCPIPRWRRHGSSSMISALSGAIRSSPVWPRERRQTRSPNYGSAIAFPERSICCR